MLTLVLLVRAKLKLMLVLVLLVVVPAVLKQLPRRAVEETGVFRWRTYGRVSRYAATDLATVYAVVAVSRFAC